MKTTQCDSCGGFFDIDELDGKPTIDGHLHRTLDEEGQLVMLSKAADLGYDFDRLECRHCYGPGYISL